MALWNGHDPILKQRLFGLTNSEGNYGEEYYFTADWVLHKALIIGETRDLTLRSEVYNVFNTTNLNLPNGGVDAGVGSTGRITSLYSPMRQMQLGMRFQF